MIPSFLQKNITSYFPLLYSLLKIFMQNIKSLKSLNFIIPNHENKEYYPPPPKKKRKKEKEKKNRKKK